MNRTILGWAASIVVVAAVVAGFITVGSPAAQRKAKFDQQRVNDLSMIQNEIRNYWSTTNKVPAKLSDINSDINGFTLPKDPETKADYEYAVKGDLSFELCATFNSEYKNDNASRPMMYPYYGNETWVHGTGRVCFTRTLNPTVDKLTPPIY